MSQTAQKIDRSNGTQTLYMAFELSNSEWKLAFGISVGHPPRHVTVPARELGTLKIQIERAKKRFGLDSDCRVVSCYEAGRDGFWIHRYLISGGVNNHVVDSSSIEVNRRARRAKTDRLDAGKLLKLLIRHDSGEPRVWSVVRVPTKEEEDERRIHRELERLKQERTGHSNRIRSLLTTHGIVGGPSRYFQSFLENVRLWDGSALGPHMKAELLREHERWEQVHKQILSLEKYQRVTVKSPEQAKSIRKAEKVRDLVMLKGIGEISAWTLVHEFFWREFSNRREVGGASGLAGTPFDSGGSDHEQGISKAGNRRVRKLMTEVAWFWIRYQPESTISQWFERRFAHGGKRMRRVGIVGVARRVLIALWRYLKDGVVPDGAQFKTTQIVTAQI